MSDQNRAGTVPTISFDVLERILARSLPTFAERADRLLLEAVRDDSNTVLKRPLEKAPRLFWAPDHARMLGSGERISAHLL